MRRIGLAVSCGLAVLAAPFHQAHAAADAVVATGTASLTDFSYTVTSLASGSGHAPWVTFGAEPAYFQGTLETMGRAYFNQGGAWDATFPNADYVRYDGLMPTTTINTASKDGMATGQATPTSLRAGIEVRAGALENMNPVGDGSGNAVLNVFSHDYTGAFLPNQYIQGVDYPAGGGVDLTLGSPQATGYNFILSPHSVLEIRGVLSASVSMAPSYLPSSLIQGSSVLQSNAVASLQFAEPLAPLQTHYASWSDYAEDSNRVFGASFKGVSASWFPGWSTETTQNDEQLMTLTLVNDTDQARKGALVFQVSSTLNLTSAVPEPGTFTLAFGGLICLGWMRRRHG